MRLLVVCGRIPMAWLPAVLALLAGCAGSGQMVSLDVVPKLPPAQALASDPVKIVIEPFEVLDKKNRDALCEEGERLVRFIGEGAEAFEVRLVERT